MHLRDVRKHAKAALVVTAAILVCAGWLASSPHSSSPDDDFHMASIWCAAGFQDGVCEPGSGNYVHVPSALAGEPCYARRQSLDAGCHQVSLGHDEELNSVNHWNSGRSRPNVFYRVMHAFVGDDLVKSIGMMRIFNAVVALALGTATFWIARRSVRQALAASWLVASVPLGLFLLTSTNSGAWAIVGVATFWAAFLTALEAQDRRQKVVGATLAAVAATLAIGSRYESVMFLGISAIATTLVATRAHIPALRSRRTIAVTAGISVAGTAVLFGFRNSFDNLLSVLRGVRSGFAALAERDIGNPFFYNTVELPLIWTGIFGYRGGRGSLGWLDTTMPALVYVPMIAVFAALVFYGLGVASRAKAINVTMIAGSLIALPWLWFAAGGYLMQENIQPRHFMGLFYVLIAFALVGDRDQRPIMFTRAQRFVVVASTSVAHSVALHVNTRRYVTGHRLDNWEFQLNRDIQWWWHNVPMPMTMWLAASVAFVVVAYAAMRIFAPEIEAPARQKSIERLWHHLRRRQEPQTTPTTSVPTDGRNLD